MAGVPPRWTLEKRRATNSALAVPKVTEKIGRGKGGVGRDEGAKIVRAKIGHAKIGHVRAEGAKVGHPKTVHVKIDRGKTVHAKIGDERNVLVKSDRDLSRSFFPASH